MNIETRTKTNATILETLLDQEYGSNARPSAAGMAWAITNALDPESTYTPSPDAVTYEAAVAIPADTQRS